MLSSCTLCAHLKYLNKKGFLLCCTHLDEKVLPEPPLLRHRPPHLLLLRAHHLPLLRLNKYLLITVLASWYADSIVYYSK